MKADLTLVFNTETGEVSTIHTEYHNAEIKHAFAILCSFYAVCCAAWQDCRLMLFKLRSELLQNPNQIKLHPAAVKIEEHGTLTVMA